MAINHENFSFEVSAPSALLLNPNIDDRACRLFCVIKGLTRVHGYCYATNAYLAQVLNTSEPTIKRTLRSLKDEGFVEIQTDKTGIHWQRRIFLGGGLKKCLRRITDDLPPDHGRPPPRSPVIHNKELVNKEVLKEETPPNPLKGEIEVYGKFVRLTKEELVSLTDQFGRTEVIDIMNQINDYLASTGKKPYKDYAATIRNWMRKRQNEPAKNHQTTSEKNKQLAQKICEKLNRSDMELTSDALMFVNYGAGGNIHIAFKELGFRDQVLSRLRKMGLVVEGL